MNAKPAALIVMCGLLAGCAGITDLQSPVSGAGVDSAQRLLITMRQETGRALPQLGDPASFYQRRRGYAPLPGTNRMLDQIAEDYDIRRIEGWFVSAIGQYCEVFELQPGQSREELIQRISADPRVELVQAMNQFETLAVRYDDPLAPLQPALEALAIDSAHEMATGRGVTVAVIDSSVDRRHPELRGQIRTQRNLVSREAAGAEVHGTAVAGVIGSAANNGAGIVGIAPDAEIISLRACWTVDPDSGQARCSSYSLALALEMAIRMHTDVINLSLSGPHDPLLGELLNAAIDNDIIVIAALPSAVGDTTVFPSSHTGVIAVGSSDDPVHSQRRDVLQAPGAEIMSTIPDDGYAVFSGSSMSAAYVAGISALIRERAADIQPAAVRDLLAETASDQSVNACRAIAATGAATRSC